MSCCVIASGCVARRRRAPRRPRRSDQMDWGAIGAAGVASGTILLFAAVGEIFAERSGVLNLGVEGMMFMGAVAGLGVAVASGSPVLGIVAALLAGGLLALLHGVITIHLQADQIVSGLALTFLGT